MIKHDDLARKLAAHLAANSDRMIWTDMQLGPSGSPRPDVYTMMKSYSDPRPMAYECKISVADFRSDVTTGKWMSYLAYAYGVTFCFPAGMVAKEDVPKSCGLIIYNEATDTFKTVRAATLARCILPQEALLKLLMDGLKRMHDTNRRPETNLYTLSLKLRKTMGSDVADYILNRDNARRVVDQEHKWAEDARQLRRQTEKEIEDIKKKAREEGNAQAEKKMAEARGYIHAVCRELGIREQDTWGHQIDQAIRDLKASLDRDTEIIRLRGVINNIAHSINRETKHIAKGLEEVTPISP